MKAMLASMGINKERRAYLGYQWMSLSFVYEQDTGQ